MSGLKRGTYGSLNNERTKKEDEPAEKAGKGKSGRQPTRQERETSQWPVGENELSSMTNRGHNMFVSCDSLAPIFLDITHGACQYCGSNTTSGTGAKHSSTERQKNIQ